MEQIPEEIAAFTAWLGPLHHVLEIGVRRGGTIRHWHQHATGMIVGVDYMGPDSLGGGTLSHHLALRAELPRFGSVIGDSHAPETLVNLRRPDLLGECLVDLLFIDGDHSYEGAKQDYETYGRLVKPGGVIAFHDIVDSPLMRRVGHGVYKLWAELKKDYPDRTFEFIHGTNEWGGIGALRL